MTDTSDEADRNLPNYEHAAAMAKAQKDMTAARRAAAQRLKEVEAEATELRKLLGVVRPRRRRKAKRAKGEKPEKAAPVAKGRRRGLPKGTAAPAEAVGG